MHLLLFCTMTNKCTIISQIITLLHVSAVSCHPQEACNQYLAKLHKFVQHIISISSYMFRPYYVILREFVVSTLLSCT
jgi:hypothetical protein